MTETAWLGAGSFRALLAQCVDLGLEVSVSRAPHYLWDPARHEPPLLDTLGAVLLGGLRAAPAGETREAQER